MVMFSVVNTELKNKVFTYYICKCFNIADFVTKGKKRLEIKVEIKQKDKALPL